MPQYKDKIPTNQDKFITKSLVVIFIIIFVSIILRYINKYDNFQDTIKFSFLIWTIVNIYDCLVIDIIWFCHSKKVMIEGTEDMIDAYHDYLFHIIESLKGEVIGLIVCLIISLIIHFIL